MAFLPVTKKDIKDRGWDSIDFLYITGDAYIDHPSFGCAIISRVLESKGYKVAIVSQPSWDSIDDFIKLGTPNLGILVSSGVLDSMVNNYTAALKRRRVDKYSPNEDINKKPDRALLVYCNLLKQAFKGIPIIIGGLEAGLRRFAHYDYWSNKVRRSILFDTRADILIYGMGEKPILEIAERLKNKAPLDGILQTAIIAKEYPGDAVILPSYEAVKDSKEEYAKAFVLQHREQNQYKGKTLVQEHNGRFLVNYPSFLPMNEKEMDEIYDLNYERTYHPMYEKDGGIKAIEEVKTSITSHRGCFGGCNFCSIVFHQGKVIQKRSKESIIREANIIASDKDFKGYINDVGGPTANFRNAYCKIGTCKTRECLFPSPCKNLVIDHKEYLSVLRTLRNMKNVKKVFVKSGVRYDYVMLDKDSSFINDLCKFHVSGQLKVAPEHASENVLESMGKQSIEIYKQFKEKFDNINLKNGQKQYLIPYLISGHPGETINDSICLTEFLMDSHFIPDQMQDFYPTPGTASTCMYYTGLNPFTMEKIYVSKGQVERDNRRALLQFNKPYNAKKAKVILRKNHRDDLAKRIYIKK